jgi:hypothetical protein
MAGLVMLGLAAMDVVSGGGELRARHAVMLAFAVTLLTLGRRSRPDDRFRPELRFEQIVRCRDTGFQFAFGLEAIKRVPKSDRYRLLPSKQGLRVLGRDRESLQEALSFLSRAYGGRLDARASRRR